MRDFTHGLLWRIHKSGQPDAFLFGTMHVRDARAFQWLPKLQSLILEVDAFFAELDLGKTGLEMEIPALPENESLQGLVSSKRWKRINDFCIRRYHIDLDQMDRMYPLLILQQITIQHLREEHQFILDMTLYNYARDNNITCGGVEDWEDQVSLITKIPVPSQFKYLQDALEHHDSFVRQLKKLIQDYQGQNILSLYKRTRKSLGALRRPMLFQRNENMAGSISSLYADTPNSFFCVGAAHLSGYYGVLRLLKRTGFKVLPMELS